MRFEIDGETYYGSMADEYDMRRRANQFDICFAIFLISLFLIICFGMLI